jgi:uncharacterized membrane protein YecN with MAPEG domain
MRGLSLLLSACGMIAALLLWRAVVPDFAADAGAASIAVRLGEAATSLLPAAAVLAAMVMVQMAARFIAGRTDPLAGTETPFLLRNQRVITNTVEQMAIFVPAQMALAAGTDGASMPQVLALGIVFAAARLVFWAGYLAAPIARAPGMAATLAVNMAALLAAAWNLL